MGYILFVGELITLLLSRQELQINILIKFVLLMG